MALIHCPDCEREVSSRARSCPQCAYPVENLTSLADAIHQNDIDLLRDMLRAGFQPDQAKEDGITGLMTAVKKGNYTATKLLVESGADVNRTDATEKNALDYALSNGQEQIAQYLKDKGAHTKSVKKPLTERAPKEVPARVESPAAASEAEIQSDPEIQPDPEMPPPIPAPTVLVQPPPLPIENAQKQSRRVAFVDDTVPIKEDEKYPGPGLICRTCKGGIAAEDIWCAHCKAPIIRRYCGGCHELIPDNAAQCPYCNSSKLHRFRYIRHLEQFVAGAAVLGVLLFIFSIYGPNDGVSYAQKMASKRAEQQEQIEIAAEQKSKQSQEERSNARRATTAPVRVVPRKATHDTIVPSNDKQRIPTVERIESSSELPKSDEPTNMANNTPKPDVVQTPELDQQLSREDPPATTVPETGPDSRPAEPENQTEHKTSIEIGRRLNDHGFRLMKRGRYAEAIPVLAQAVRSYPPGEKDLSYAYALYNLGRSLRLVGRPDLAIPILEERMKFADQRHVVARELELAREETSGREPVNKVDFE